MNFLREESLVLPVAKFALLDHAWCMKTVPAKPKSKEVKAQEESFAKRYFAAERALEAAELKIKLQALTIADLERENSRLRSGRSAGMDLLQQEISSRDVQIIQLQVELGKANKQLEWFRKAKFGSSSEGIKPDEGKNQPANSSSMKGQQIGTKGHGRSSKSETNTVIKYLDIPDCKCQDCGEPYRLLNRTESSPLSEIEIELIRTEYQRCIYVSKCSCKGRQIKVADPPKKLFPRTEIGNSLWVWLIVQKFLHGMPQNRALKQLSLWGLGLPAGTVTGGNKVINDLLEPLTDALTDRCRAANYWNVDETTWRVFAENKQRWWFWLIASKDAVVYLLDPSRSSTVPKEFFAGSTGILMSDRFSSYKNLQSSIRNAWCWVHLRRDFLKIFTGVPKLKQWAKAWLLEISQLYVKRHKQFNSWQKGGEAESEYIQASIELEKHVTRIKEKWEKEVARTGLHRDQSKVLRSLKRHWKGLTIFLEDPRIALDNNRAERLLRNPVILRKNSFGSGAAWAGQMAARIFSLTQTWLLNGLDPQKIFLDYFNECSSANGPPSDIAPFLPWSMTPERKAQFALPDSYKRPG